MGDINDAATWDNFSIHGSSSNPSLASGAWYQNGTMYATASDDRGVRWTAPHVIGTDVSQPGQIDAALGADGAGWLTYDQPGGGEVRAIALDLGAFLPRSHKRHRHVHHPIWVVDPGLSRLPADDVDPRR